MTEFDSNIKTVKIGNKTIVTGDKKNDIDLSNLHVADEVNEVFQSKYDNNYDGKISTKSSASIFTKDLHEMIGDDNKISDAEIEAFIKNKNFLNVTKEEVKNILTELFSSKKDSPFDETKKAVKIDGKTIYIGDKLNKDIDLSKFYQKGYSSSEFLSIYSNAETKSINSNVEADKLYSDILSLCNEEGEITDEKIIEFIKKNPNLRGLDLKFFKEFLIQALAPEKTDEEKQKYFEENKQKIKDITNQYNLINTSFSNKYVQIGKDIVKAFKGRYGEPYSPSMQMLIEKEYYQNNMDAINKIMNIRVQIATFTNLEDCKLLSDEVIKNRVANCQEDAALTCLLLKEKYPDIEPYTISYHDESGLSDKEHIAVIIFGDEYKDTIETEQYGDKYKTGDDLTKYKGAYIIDNWFGGVFRAEDWIKMQEKLHESEAYSINTVKSSL